MNREWAKMPSRVRIHTLVLLSRVQVGTCGSIVVGWILVTRDVYVVLAFELSRVRSAR